MPNWCVNYVSIDFSDADEEKRFRELFDTEKGTVLRMRPLFPYPEPLEKFMQTYGESNSTRLVNDIGNTDKFTRDDTGEWKTDSYFSRGIPLADFLKNAIEKTGATQEDIEKTKKIIDSCTGRESPDLETALRHLLEVTDGYTHTNAFNTDKGGTKWDFDANLDWPIKHSCSGFFETAWNPPEEFFLALSREFPSTEIFLKYAEMGNELYGEMSFYDGCGNECECDPDEIKRFFGFDDFDEEDDEEETPSI